jgi:DNA-directed RNA polymerase specialized sigma24 family protein
MIYCVVPGDLAPKVARILERSWRDDPSIAVVMERRASDRRQTGGRRAAGRVRSAGTSEGRRVRYPDGRRIAERRATLVPVAGPAWPRGVRRHADRLVFGAPLQPPPELREAVDSVRAIVRFQSGDQRSVRELYERYFDRVYTYLRATIKHRSYAEERTRDVFLRMVEELPRLALAPAQVEPWLFGIAHRATLEAVAELALNTDASAWGGSEHHADGAESLEWLNDDELQLLIERAPMEERHVLMLRYMARLSFVDLGVVLGIAPDAAVELHRRAVSALDASLATMSRGPQAGGRHAMSRFTSQTPVLRQRRRALAV